MRKRIVANLINQVILWPMMEIAMIPIVIIVILISGFMMKNTSEEIGWIFILLMIPFGAVDRAGLSVSFLIRLWMYAVSLVGETTYFLFMAPVMTYMYFQLSEFVMMVFFKRDFGKMILRQQIVATCGGSVSRERVIKRGFYKWHMILFSPVVAVICVLKGKNIFYDKKERVFYWDKKAGTKVINL